MRLMTFKINIHWEGSEQKGTLIYITLETRCVTLPMVYLLSYKQLMNYMPSYVAMTAELSRQVVVPTPLYSPKL